jgi:hypothetical protein
MSTTRREAEAAQQIVLDSPAICIHEVLTLGWKYVVISKPSHGLGA